MNELEKRIWAKSQTINGGEWQGKAGGYAIQGAAAAFIPWIGGSYSNVVGLPLTEVLATLNGLGWLEAHK